MEHLPAFAYLHPVWQGLTLVLGMYLAATGVRNIENPNFSVRKHKRIGRIFLIMILAGAVFGKVIAASLPLGTFRMPGHVFLAVLITILTILGAVFGFQGERKRLRVRTGMMRAHPWFYVAVTALVFAQALMGLRALRIIKF
jgi:uncharacterized membrane protein YozB (DUF420 family)